MSARPCFGATLGKSCPVACTVTKSAMMVAQRGSLSRERAQGAKGFLWQWGWQLTERANKPAWVLLQCFSQFFPQCSDGALCKV